MSSVRACIKPAFQAIKGGRSAIYSISPLLFFAIVAVVEVEVSRCQVLKGDFRKFQEWEARNECLQAESHMQRRHSVADMVVAYHLGGRLGMHAWSSVAGGIVQMR